MEEAGRCGTPRRGKSVDQLVMSCAVDGEPGLAAVVGKHKGGSIGAHGQHLVDDKAGLPAPGAEHHHIGTLCLDGPQVAQHSVESGILRGYRNDVPAIHHRGLVGLCTGHGVVGGRRAVLLRLRCAAAAADAVLVLVAQRGNNVGMLTGLLVADAALLYRVAAFRAGGGNGGLFELMARSFNDVGMRAVFLVAAAALAYRVAILGAGGLDCYRPPVKMVVIYRKLDRIDDLTAGAAPVVPIALFRTIRENSLFIDRVAALLMLALFRGLLLIPVGHPFVGLICFGHRVRVVMAYIGHFYFCTVLDALVSAKLILAVLDSISTLLTSRSAIANGSACAIILPAVVVLGTAGGLDLRLAANGHLGPCHLRRRRCLRRRRTSHSSAQPSPWRYR